MNYTTEQIKHCGEYLRHFGSNYLLATKLFPRDIQNSTLVLYAFVRYADEIIDNPTNNHPEKELLAWKQKWEETYHHNVSHDMKIDAMVILCKKYTISLNLIEAFFESMLVDHTKNRYGTYKELEKYMWGSASVVGLMMSKIIGTTTNDDSYRDSAIALSEAMQLTNFIRDIDEDYQGRGRVYLPQELLKKYHLDESWIVERKMTHQSTELIKALCEKAHELFKKGNAGISLLKPEGRLPVLIASQIYEHILILLEKEHYNVFSPRIHNTKWDKVRIFTLMYLKNLCKKF
jgi:phytoene synthase